MILKSVRRRIIFLYRADRLGIDEPLTHWRLHHKPSMQRICKKKFGSFGEGSEFRPGAFAEACSRIFIGNDVVIRPGSFLYADPDPRGGSIHIEDGVLIGPGVHVYTANHEFSDPNRLIIDQGYPVPTLADSVIFRRGCWIGAGSIILPGVEIGENTVIGAGSVVTKSVPPYTVWAGNPAREIKRLK